MGIFEWFSLGGLLGLFALAGKFFHYSFKEGARQQRIEDRLEGLEKKDKTIDAVLKGIQDNLTELSKFSIESKEQMKSLQGDVKDLKTDIKEGEKSHQKIFEAVSDIRVDVAEIKRNGNGKH